MKRLKNHFTPESAKHIGVGNPRLIHWFPGHMAKALKQFREKIKLVDILLEVRDARAPLTSTNHELLKELGAKGRVILLNKTDLADPDNLAHWIAYLRSQGETVLSIEALGAKGIQAIEQTAKSIMAPKHERLKRKGIRPPPIRLIVAGLPNTGKSTLINRLAKKKATKTGPRPGITQHTLWTVIGKNMELLDTPGIMPPKIANLEDGLCLTAIHCIKDEIPGARRTAVHLLKQYIEQKPEALRKRYDIEEELDPEITLELIGLRHGFLKSQGVVNEEQASYRVLKDFRDGYLEAIVWERPPKIGESVGETPTDLTHAAAAEADAKFVETTLKGAEAKKNPTELSKKDLEFMDDDED
ncbi:MAG: ribosome biogenesis GTPase YlqF [SAR324 cluster bacterium]|nr:ribosome biogenesis GTPase YlqF [SAR324 cluster bacterium]